MLRLTSLKHWQSFVVKQTLFIRSFSSSKVPKKQLKNDDKQANETHTKARVSTNITHRSKQTGSSRTTNNHHKKVENVQPTTSDAQQTKIIQHQLQDSQKPQQSQLSQDMLQQSPQLQPHQPQLQTQAHQTQNELSYEALHDTSAWKSQIQSFGERNGLSFLEPQLLEEALSHRFIVHSTNDSYLCNDRLVFYGKALADLQLTEYYMSILPRGAQLATRICLKRNNLYTVGQKFGLDKLLHHKFLSTNSYDIVHPLPESKRLELATADTVLALVAAVHLHHKAARSPSMPLFSHRHLALPLTLSQLIKSHRPRQVLDTYLRTRPRPPHQHSTRSANPPHSPHPSHMHGVNPWGPQTQPPADTFSSYAIYRILGGKLSSNHRTSQAHNAHYSTSQSHNAHYSTGQSHSHPSTSQVPQVTVGVFVDGKLVTTEHGASVGEAEELAAVRALEILQSRSLQQAGAHEGAVVGQDQELEQQHA